MILFTDKFFQYILNIPSKDRTVAQPKSVLLESQYLQHHFVHWDLPSRSVTCKVSQKYWWIILIVSCTNISVYLNIILINHEILHYGQASIPLII